VIAGDQVEQLLAGDEGCSDGFVQPGNGEECDAGVENSDNAACTTTCKNNICGDSAVFNVGGGTEECDNGGDNGPEQLLAGDDQVELELVDDGSVCSPASERGEVLATLWARARVDALTLTLTTSDRAAELAQARPEILAVGPRGCSKGARIARRKCQGPGRPRRQLGLLECIA